MKRTPLSPSEVPVPRFASLCLLFTACAATPKVAAPPAPTPIVTPPAPVAASPSPLEVITSACPRALEKTVLPACGFRPSKVRVRGALLKASETTCQLALAARFAAPEALALAVDAHEGSRYFTLSFIERLDGSRIATADSVRDPLLTTHGVAGIEMKGGRSYLWVDGQCEAPRDGNFDSLATLGDGALLTRWRRGDGNEELVLRSPEGAWSSLGALPLGVTLRLVTGAGRAALAFVNESTWDRRDFGLYSTDTGRASVFARRTSSPTIASWGLGGSWYVAAPRAGARLSDAVNLKTPPYMETPTLFRTDPVQGGARVELPKLAFAATACRTPKTPDEKVVGTWRSSSDFTGADVDGTLLLARLERSGECVAKYEPPPPFSCPPGAPCAPPPGPRLTTTNTERSSELVLFAVERGDVVRELARVALPIPEERRGVGGLAVSVTETRVWVMVTDQLLEFDRARLLGSAR